MASLGLLFNKFLSLFLLLLHFGCFIFTDRDHENLPSKKRKLSPSSSSSSRPRKAISSSWSYIKSMFSCKKSAKTLPEATPTPTLTSARSSQNSLVSLVTPETHHNTSLFEVYHGACNVSEPPREKPDISADPLSFPLRNDIFPCTACGEIFPKPQLLEQHQALKHAVSELTDGDSGKNIVRIIFKTGWQIDKTPTIHRILKIHNSPKIISRFEEYRQIVKIKATRRKQDERCMVDGNELLRFHCSTFLCDLGLNGNSSICSMQYCSICGIIRSGFSHKMDGISTLSSSWRAHMAVPEDIEEEFKFMNVKRATLVCRVIAGRVGCDSDEFDKDDGGFDSVLGRSGSGVHTRLDEEELIVFNPKAVLPCFVIVYTV